MLIHLHKQTTTTPTPKVQAAIRVSTEPTSALAERFGTTEQTIYKCKYSDTVHGVCQTSCPPISCGVSDFGGAGTRSLHDRQTSNTRFDNNSWFHITMRITVMHQYVKGLAHLSPEEAEEMARYLRQIKGCLWNGNLHDGQAAIDDLVMDLDEIETGYAGTKALRKAANEFQTYIANNAWMIPNYAERRRYGERVSTGFVESTVNTVVGKRFCKRQQMRWSKTGAHLMLQTRTRTLDGTLRPKFQQWYPGMKADGEIKMAA